MQPLAMNCYIWRVDKLTPTIRAEQKQMVARRHVAVSESLLLLVVPAIPG